MKLGEIESIIQKEFSGGPPERRAAEKLYFKNITSNEILELLKTNRSLLPSHAINNTINELRNLELGLKTRQEIQLWKEGKKS